MEDLVAVAVELESGETRFFITCGRIQSKVDPTALEEIVMARASGFALGGRAVRARLAGSLQEAAGELYFFEALFDFSQRQIPYGPDYQAWCERIDREMRAGKHLYFLGRRRS